jgi:secondary thiamine-phosphate synthase enzyme
MWKKVPVSTHARTELVNIDRFVAEVVREEGVSEGVCYIYVPHTTAGITINENADPAVREDIVDELNKIVPFEDGYRHLEGNAAAHIKACIVGFSQIVPVKRGKLALGTWQSIYFCEFDGPRQRHIYVQVIAG